MVAIGHKQCIRRVHNGEIADAQRRHQGAVCHHQTVPGLDRKHLSPDGIAVIILFKRRPQSLPGADIIPPCVQGHHHGIGGLFHYRVIN